MLEGIQIFDFVDEKASFCSKLLADLGARVIKMEKPGGDSSREIGPFRTRTSRVKESANEDLFRWLNAAHSSL